MILTYWGPNTSDLCTKESTLIMKPNMGFTDRIIRAAMAIVIAVLYLSGVLQGVTGIVALVLAAVFAFTSLFRFCPLYLPFGIRTNTKK